jgi:hypothetical protein
MPHALRRSLNAARLKCGSLEIGFDLTSATAPGMDDLLAVEGHEPAS